VLLQTVTNPSGLRVSENQIAELVRKAPHDCHIILDECHDYLGPAVNLTMERRKANVVSVHSISKLWAAPGLKAGWIVASPEIVNAFYEYASTIYSGPPSLTFLLLEIFGIFESARQLGNFDVVSTLSRLPASYRSRSEDLLSGFDNYVRSYDILRNKVSRAKLIASTGFADAGFDVLVPDYSINLLTRFGDLPSYYLFRNLISETKVSVYPGLLCGIGTPGIVRISPCVPEPVLVEAIQRVKNWCKGT
jgi:aspartate/methionine/tyrosine aminotransferase